MDNANIMTERTSEVEETISVNVGSQIFCDKYGKYLTRAVFVNIWNNT
jgi:hypothetical protein